MMKIGVIVAMDKEFLELKSLLSDSIEEANGLFTYTFGKLGNKEIILQQCGIGKVNSTIGAVEIITKYDIDLLISSGVAGGLSNEINPLDIVIGTSYTYHDVYCGDEVSFGQIPNLPQKYLTEKKYITNALSLTYSENIYSGMIVSGDWFVNTKEKALSILKYFPEAKAVDMESCSIAQVAYRYKIPFISFRIISDVPTKDNKASQYYNFWDKMAKGSFSITRNFLKLL